MRPKTPMTKRKIPASLVKRLSRELAAFGPDLPIQSNLLAVTPPEGTALLGDKPRSRARQPAARMLMSVDLAPQAESGWWDRKREALLKRAAELRNKYRNNPYIEVKGFSIGLPLTLTIDFEFK